MDHIDTIVGRKVEQNEFADLVQKEEEIRTPFSENVINMLKSPIPAESKCSSEAIKTHGMLEPL